MSIYIAYILAYIYICKQAYLLYLLYPMFHISCRLGCLPFLVLLSKHLWTTSRILSHSSGTVVKFF